MKNIIVIFGLCLLLGACSTPDERRLPDNVKEYSFAGGRFINGQVEVNADYKVEQDPVTKQITLSRISGGGLGTTLDCVCTSGGGGGCFPVTQTMPNGSVWAGCASIAPCNDCDQIITVPGGDMVRARCQTNNLMMSQ